jgi:hypothetical protein
MAYHHGADNMDHSEDTTLASRCKKVWLSYDCLHDTASIIRNPDCWLCREQDGLCEPTLMEDVVDACGECVDCVVVRSEIAARAEEAERERERRRWLGREEKEKGFKRW